MNTINQEKDRNIRHDAIQATEQQNMQQNEQEIKEKERFLKNFGISFSEKKGEIFNKR